MTVNPVTCQPDDITAWISLNSFAARLHGQSVHSCTNFAIWEFRTALEDEHPSSTFTQNKQDCMLATTSQWILHAGSVLYEEARNPSELSETQKRMYKTGKLCDAGPGMNLERWVFWRKRLEELGPKAGREVQEDVEEAVRKIKELENEDQA